MFGADIFVEFQVNCLQMSLNLNAAVPCLKYALFLRLFLTGDHVNLLGQTPAHYTLVSVLPQAWEFPEFKPLEVVVSLLTLPSNLGHLK